MATSVYVQQKPLLEAKQINYRSDGKGRDSYILFSKPYADGCNRQAFAFEGLRGLSPRKYINPSPG